MKRIYIPGMFNLYIYNVYTHPDWVYGSEIRCHYFYHVVILRPLGRVALYLAQPNIGLETKNLGAKHQTSLW